MNDAPTPPASALEEPRITENEWPIFISYRRGELTRKIALWLKRELESETIRSTTGQVFRLKVFVDVAEPHQADFQANLVPYLQHSRALIVLADEAASSKNGEARDYLYEELDWWAEERRKTPPIVLQLDANSAIKLVSDDKYERWRKVNFIDCFWVKWEGESDSGKSEREQLLRTLRESVRNYGQVIHLDEVRRLRKRAFFAILFALAALVAAGVAWRQYSTAAEQRDRADVAKKQADRSAANAIQNLSRSDFATANRLLDQGDDKNALTYLAKVYREDPLNPAVPALLYNTLVAQKAWPLPLNVPLFFKDPVRLVRFSPDGTRFLTLCSNALGSPATVQIWESANLKPVGQPIQPGHEIDSVQFSPDGRRLLTWDNLSAPQLWDTSTGYAVGQSLLQPVVATDDVMFTPDSLRVLQLSTLNGSLKTWDAKTGASIDAGVPVDFGKAGGERISPDGRHLLAGTLDFIQQIWDVNKGAFLADPIAMNSVIMSQSFSSDGKWLELATQNKILIVDVQTGRPTGSPLAMNSLALAKFSPDGTKIIAGGGQEVRIWNVATRLPIGPEIRQLTGAESFAFSAKGDCVLIQEFDRFRIWDTSLAAPLCRTIAPIEGKSIASSDLNSDGNRALTAAGNQVQLWEVRPADMPLPDWLATLAEAQAGMRATDKGDIVAEPADELINLQAKLGNATGDDYWTRVGRWFFTPTNKLTLSPQTDLTTADMPQTTTAGPTIISPASSILAKPSAQPEHSQSGLSESLPANAALADTKVRAQQEIDQAAALLVAKNPKNALPHLARALRDDPDNIAAVTLTFTTLMSQQNWPLPSAMPVYFSDSISCVNYSPDGSRLVTVSSSLKGESTVQIWNGNTLAARGAPFHADTGVDSARFSNDNSVLVTYGRTAAPRLWDTASGQQIGQPLAENGQTFLGATQVFFTTDGKVVKVGSILTLGIWDAHTGKVLMPEQEVGLPSAESAVLSPDSRHFALHLVGGTVIIWNVAKRQPVGNPLPPSGTMSALEFSPDSKRLVVGSLVHGIARLWDVDSATQIGKDISIKYGVTAAHFSPDSTKFIVTGSNTAEIFDAATALPVGTGMTHIGFVTDADFSSNGEAVLTTCYKSVRLWKTANGMPLSDPITPSDKEQVAHALIGPNGEIVTVAGKALQVWDQFPSPVPAPKWLPDLAEAIGGSRISDSGELKPVFPELLASLKAQLSAPTGTDYWSRVGRWYFSDPSSRSISPQSDVPLPDYVHHLIDSGTDDSLAEAQRAGAQNTDWLTEIAAKRKTLPSP
jgi:WD40 repeat protein